MKFRAGMVHSWGKGMYGAFGRAWPIGWVSLDEQYLDFRGIWKDLKVPYQDITSVDADNGAYIAIHFLMQKGKRKRIFNSFRNPSEIMLLIWNREVFLQQLYLHTSRASSPDEYKLINTTKAYHLFRIVLDALTSFVALAGMGLVVFILTKELFLVVINSI